MSDLGFVLIVLGAVMLAFCGAVLASDWLASRRVSRDDLEWMSEVNRRG